MRQMANGGQGRRGSATTLWFARLGWFIVPIALAYLALPRLTSGMATDSAFPVPTYIAMNYPLPSSAYREAAGILAGADPNDSEAMIARAEAMSRSGAAPSDVIAVLTLGLSDAPASARGWTLLAEQEGKMAHDRAATPLALALSLGSYDYWLAGRRAGDAVILWDALDPADKSAALNQLRLLWDEPLLRSEIMPLLTLQGGPALMTRALAGSPDDVRALNRWISESRRKTLGRQ